MLLQQPNFTNKGLSYLKTILIASQLIHLQYRLRHDCTPHSMKHIRWGGLKEVVGRVSIRCWPLGRGHCGRLRSWKSHSCCCRTDACFWDFKIKISNLWFLIETSCCKIQMNLQCTEILMNTANTLSWFANIPVLKGCQKDRLRERAMSALTWWFF